MKRILLGVSGVAVVGVAWAVWSRRAHATPSCPAQGRIEASTPDHAGHECGLACDLRLPRMDGSAGGITWRDNTYDQRACRAQLKALHAQTWTFHRALFNDPKLIAEGLCRHAPNHDDHIHFEIEAMPIAIA